MAYNPEYYQEKRQKLEIKGQNNLQFLVNACIAFVDEARDIKERIIELNQTEEKSKQEIETEPKEK